MATTLETCVISKKHLREFHFFERKSIKNFHKWLMNVYGKAAFDVSIVRKQVSRVKSNPRQKGETDFSDRPCSGRLSAAVNADKGRLKEANHTKKVLENLLKIWIYMTSFKGRLPQL